MATGNAMNLGSLFVEMGLKTQNFNQQLGEMQRQTSNTFGNIQAAARTMAFVTGAAFTAGAIGIAKTVEAASEFQAVMKGVEALARDATRPQLEALADVATRLGAETFFSATQAAEGIQELVRGGVEVTEILNGAAEASVKLAAAGRVDLTSAAEFTSKALSAFSLQGSEAVRVVDLLAGAATSSATTIPELTFAFRQSASVAAQLKLPIEDLITGFAVLASNAITGSDAGTSFRVMLSRLNAQTGEAQTKMRELGIITESGANRFFKASGEMRGLAEISGVLSDALGDMTVQQQNAALQVLFGQDAVRAAAAIMKAGASGVREFAGEIQGVSAADVAAKQMEGLAGSVEELRGSMETMLKEFGDPLLDPLEKVADEINKVVDAFAEMPDGIKEVAAWLGVGATLTAGVGLATALTALTAPGIIAGLPVVAAGLSKMGAALVVMVSSPLGPILLAGTLAAALRGLKGALVLDEREIKSASAWGKILDELVGGPWERSLDEIRAAAESGALQNAITQAGETTGASLAKGLVEGVAKSADLERAIIPNMERIADSGLRGMATRFEDAASIIGPPLEAAFDTSLDRLDPRLEDFVADLSLAVPEGLGRGLKFLAPGTPFFWNWERSVGSLPDALTPTVEHLSEMHAALEVVGTELSTLPDDMAAFTGAIERAAGEKGAIGLLASGFDDLRVALIGKDGDGGSESILDAVDRAIPKALGDAIAGIVTMQTDWDDAWTGFTEALKRIWNSAVSDMFSAFTRGLLSPVKREIESFGESIFDNALNMSDLVHGPPSPTPGPSAPLVHGPPSPTPNPLVHGPPSPTPGPSAPETGSPLVTTDGKEQSGAEKVVRKAVKVVGRFLGLEALGKTLQEAGFDASTPSEFAKMAYQAFSAGGESEIGLTGKRITNGSVPEAAWQFLFPTAYANARDALFHDILDWRVSRVKGRQDLKSLHPHSRTGGTLRGVRLTVITTTNNVVPTQIGHELLMNGALTPTELGVDARWIGVGKGTHIAIIPEGEGLKFLEVDLADEYATSVAEREPDFTELANTFVASGAITKGEVAQFVSLVPTLGSAGAVNTIQAGRGASSGESTAAFNNEVTTSLTYPKIAAMAQTFVQGMAVLRQEEERDLSGAGIFDQRQQTSLSAGLERVRWVLGDAIAATRISLGSIPIPGSDATYGDVVTGVSRASASFTPGALLNVNVDKFFGTDAELRQLTDEIIRIARQEGLVLNPIV